MNAESSHTATERQTLSILNDVNEESNTQYVHDEQGWLANLNVNTTMPITISRSVTPEQRLSYPTNAIPGSNSFTMSLLFRMQLDFEA